jgi:hypothetical protein
MEPKVDACEVPKEFLCYFRPKPGLKKRMSIVFSGDDNFVESRGGVPESYGGVDYDIEIHGHSDGLVVEGKIAGNSLLFPGKSCSADFGEYRNHWYFLVRDGNLSCAEIRNGKVVALPDAEDKWIKTGYIDTQRAVVIDAPNSPLSVGSEFSASIPSSEGACIPFKRKVSQFALVDGVESVKVTSDVSMDQQDWMTYYASFVGKISDKDQQSEIRKELKQLENCKVVARYQVEAYYGLEDGMLIYRKENRTMEASGAVTIKSNNNSYVRIS